MRTGLTLRLAAALAFTQMLALLLCTPRSARANGRFPRAQVVQPVPRGDGQTVYVRTTFGLLVSHDAGATWAWLCEAALGYQGEWDPPLTVTKDARVWLGMASGLHILTDGGCASRDVPDLAGELVTDLTNTADDAWPIVATSSQPGRPGRIWRTKDGLHFQKLGLGLPNVHFDTLEIAASRPARLYASGYLPGEMTPVHFWRSDDGGVTLKAIDPVLPRPGRLYIGAVDPNDPDRLVVRLLDEQGSDILLSTDGGKSFRSMLHMASSNYGFAVSRDGITCYAASSGAKDGVFVSHDRCATWTHGASIGTFGMRVDDRGTLWALSNPYTPGGFFAGTSKDGVTFTSLGTFARVGGPVACDAGAAVACSATWDATRSVITAATITPLPASDAAAAPESGQMSTQADAAVAPSSASPPSPKEPSRTACSCAVIGASPACRRGPASRAPYLALGAAIVVALARRTRRAGRVRARRIAGCADGSFGHHS